MRMSGHRTRVVPRICERHSNKPIVDDRPPIVGSVRLHPAGKVAKGGPLRRR